MTLLLRAAELSGHTGPDGRATDSRATDVRASDSRATDSRATDSRATDVRIADVRIADGRVTEVGPALPRRPGEALLECRGGALVTGLCDHHLHLHALAAADRSVACGPPTVRDRAGLADALAAAPADEHGWVRGVGYVDTVAGDLDSAGLDVLHAARPVRIQHRGGARWTVNTTAAARLALTSASHPGVERNGDGTPTGRLWRADDWMRARLPNTGPPDLAAVGARLARLGITAVTDATPDLDTTALDAIGTAARGGALPQRVHLLGVPLGTPAPEGTTAGPYKIVLADSDLPDPDSLADRIRAAHTTGRAIAAHCVTREALILLLVALDAAGHRPGDRIEHAALVPAELLGDLAARGLRVITQPGFLAHRGDDYLREVPTAEHPDLYRCHSLLHAGVPLALSSDAPHGPLDPWSVLAAAVRRRTPTGAVLGPAERLSPRQALDALRTPPEAPGARPPTVTPGTQANLVLLHTPLATALASPDARVVRHTIIRGQLMAE